MMFTNVITGTNTIFYLMAAAGFAGILAKLTNQLVLGAMLKAAETMSKSKHRLTELIRMTYEQTYMTYGSVNNTAALLDTHLYEYRGFLFRIHTWRQLEIQSVWFTGILAALGAWGHYIEHGLCGGMFQYMAAGAAQMLVLAVMMQLSDEAYKQKGVKIYLTDYLENVCARRCQKAARAVPRQTALSQLLEDNQPVVETKEKSLLEMQQPLQEIRQSPDEGQPAAEERVRQILLEYLEYAAS